MRPVSLLSSLSKALEILLAEQIKEFTNDQKLFSEFQSGFRASHSTTSLLFDVTDFIRQGVDRGNRVVLVLLDFAKAFNSINFDNLKNKLLTEFNFSLEASNFIYSYLSGRSQFVVVGDSRSQCLPLVSGVPQGSILGPIMFSIYINSIAQSIRNCKFHMYADDLQIMHELGPANDQINLVNEDLERILQWATLNDLSLSITKSKAIIFGREDFRESVAPIVINGNIINYDLSIKNLGLIMSYNLDWTEQVDLVCQRMYYAIRSLKRKQLGTPRATRFLLTKSLVLSHLFYCDIIFSNLNYRLMSKIKRCFNLCIRYIYGLRRYDHISHLLSSIFEIPLQKYFEFRLVQFIFKVIADPNAPSYIKNVLQFTRSNRTRKLIICTHRTSFMADALMVRGAIAWNCLPRIIRDSLTLGQFRKNCLEFYVSN